MHKSAYGILNWPFWTDTASFLFYIYVSITLKRLKYKTHAMISNQRQIFTELVSVQKCKISFALAF